VSPDPGGRPPARGEALDRRSSRSLRSPEVLRGPKVALDPWRPVRVLHERERLAGVPASGRPADRRRGRPSPAPVAPALAIFLAGAECPFRCVFCDLWRETLDGPTPPGAIAEQVRRGLGALDPPEGPEALADTVVKLYNASNFFEPRAVPEPDLDAVAELLAPARRVVVECHPRLILDGRAGRGGDLCRRFVEALSGSATGSGTRSGSDPSGGATLEVAMGLETVHPQAFPRLNKGMALEDFGRAAERLREMGVLVRAFVLVGAPFVPPEEAVAWAVRSVEHALVAGASTVALIPVRGGHGALAELAVRGRFTPPRLDQLEEALERSLAVADRRAGDGPSAVVTADLWDLERFASCGTCLPARRNRLERANLTGVLDTGEPDERGRGPEAGGKAGAAACPECGWSGSGATTG